MTGSRAGGKELRDTRAVLGVVRDRVLLNRKRGSCSCMLEVALVSKAAEALMSLVV